MLDLGIDDLPAGHVVKVYNARMRIMHSRLIAGYKIVNSVIGPSTRKEAAAAAHKFSLETDEFRS